MTGNQCQWNHTGAGDEPKDDDPFVAHRIEERSDKCHRDDQVRESQPIGTVCKKRIARIGCGERITHSREPGEKVDRFCRGVERASL